MIIYSQLPSGALTFSGAEVKVTSLVCLLFLSKIKNPLNRARGKQKTPSKIPPENYKETDDNLLLAKYIHYPNALCM